MKFFIVLLLLSNAVFAIEDFTEGEKPETNQCLDSESAKENEVLAKKHPEDVPLVRFIAIRIGLCDLVDKEIISVKDATSIFELEQDKSVKDRFKDEMKNKKEWGA